MNLFGEVDKTKEGKIKSEYPSWYFDREHKDDLVESIRHNKDALERDTVPAERRGEFREQLKKQEDLLKKIDASEPHLSEAEIDDISKIVVKASGAPSGTLGAKIADAMFKRSDMERGTTDAHEEARRISTPCIKLDEKEIEYAKACDVAISHDGKVTRKSAEKIWKILRRVIGENSNTELLRRA